MQICWRSLRGTTDWSRPVRVLAHHVCAGLAHRGSKSSWLYYNIIYIIVFYNIYLSYCFQGCQSNSYCIRPTKGPSCCWCLRCPNAVWGWEASIGKGWNRACVGFGWWFGSCWIDPMKLTKQHPFPSVSTLLSQRQRQRVPQRLLRPICGASRSALGQQVLAVYIKFSTTPTWAPHFFQPIKINYMIVVISCPGMLNLPCILKKDVGPIDAQSCTWSFAPGKSMPPFCYRNVDMAYPCLEPLWKLVVATWEGHPET